MTRRWVIWLRTALMILGCIVGFTGILTRSSPADLILLVEGAAILGPCALLDWRYPINARRQRAGKPVFFGSIFVIVLGLAMLAMNHYRAWPG